MSATIEITIPPESQAVIKKIGRLPDDILPAIKRGMDYALSIVRGRIQSGRLSGHGPYPSAEHRLGVVTQQLQRSLREEPAVITGKTVTGAIGSPVFYGALHEYGWSGTVTRGDTNYRMTIPERAPVRTGVIENAQFIAKSIGDEIEKTLEDVSK